jgi:hypothetical protein
MTSVVEPNNTQQQKPKSRGGQQHSDSDSKLSRTITTRAQYVWTQTHKRPSDEEKEEQQSQTIRRKDRPTKLGLNDTLRRIRHLVVEGRTNLEIQSILQLNERTFYRYMARIYEIDQALFLEQEKKTMATELHVFKDRLLKSYQWLVEMSENQEMNPRIRMDARRCALEGAWAVVMLEYESPRIIRNGETLENIHNKMSSYSRP